MRIVVKAKIAKMASPEALMRTVNAALRDAAEEALTLYKKTTRTWKTTVNFYIRKTKKGYSVGTRSRIYAYVDQGTRPHIIRARRAPFLVFGWPSTPKTKPGRIQSYNGAPGGPNIARLKQVYHPGGKARGFTEIIDARIDKRVRSLVRARLAAAVKRRGR